MDVMLELFYISSYRKPSEIKDTIYIYYVTSHYVSSLLRGCPSSQRLEVIDCYKKGVQNSVLCWEVVLYWRFHHT